MKNVKKFLWRFNRRSPQAKLSAWNARPFHGWLRPFSLSPSPWLSFRLSFYLVSVANQCVREQRCGGTFSAIKRQLFQHTHYAGHSFAHVSMFCTNIEQASFAFRYQIWCHSAISSVCSPHTLFFNTLSHTHKILFPSPSSSSAGGCSFLSPFGVSCSCSCSCSCNHFTSSPVCILFALSTYWSKFSLVIFLLSSVVRLSRSWNHCE